jgi:hypothetical protein
MFLQIHLECACSPCPTLCGLARTKDDERHRTLTPAWVHARDNGDLKDVWVGCKFCMKCVSISIIVIHKRWRAGLMEERTLLDREAARVLAARNDYVLLAIDNLSRPVWVYNCQITRVEIAATKRLGRRLRVAEVLLSSVSLSR